MKDKTAILYEAAGHVGRAVAHVFAREGAQLFLTGRDATPLESLASELKVFGVKVAVAEVDALDGKAVESRLAGVIKNAGGVDISYDMISFKVVQGQELSAMSIEDYLRPIEIATRTQFITATAAARHMTGRDHGDNCHTFQTSSAVGGRFRNGVRRNRGSDAHACRRSGSEGRASLLAAISQFTGILRGARRY